MLDLTDDNLISTTIHAHIPILFYEQGFTSRSTCLVPSKFPDTIPIDKSNSATSTVLIMANLVRLATSSKSGNSWNINELEAFNISIVEQEQETFFEGPLPAYTGPIAFLQYENCVEELDASSLALMKRLDLVMTITEDEKEAAVNDFAAELLRVMGYEARSTIVRRRKRIRLLMCGEQVYAETDVCVTDINFGLVLLLLVQEDRSSHIKPPQDPEPQLVAEAIAAFQSNNAKRVNDLLLDPLPSMVFPGITMTGTFPRFYKIKVTADLDYCVRHGLYPTTRTIVHRHTPRVPTRRSGMKSLDNRAIILRCYEAFKHIGFIQHSKDPFPCIHHRSTLMDVLQQVMTMVWAMTIRFLVDR